MYLKKYIKETIILLLQLLLFYVLPLSAGPTDMMGLVVLLIISVFVLSIVMGIISNSKIKYIYPFIISILFIPSIFLYYNSSAFIYVFWYLIDSILGLGIGLIFLEIIKIIKA